MRLDPVFRHLKKALFFALVPLLNGQENWPTFRGTGARGISDDTTLPMRWSETKNVAWKQDLPGRGWSSPIVWGNLVFITTVVSSGEMEFPKKGLYFGGERPTPSGDMHAWITMAMDTDTGQTVWKKTLIQAAPTSSIHVKNTYASETPVCDGKHLYVYLGYKGLYCLDMQGNLVWKKNWKSRKTRYGWGTSSSPILHHDKVIIVNDNMEDSWMGAFDKATGKEIWKIKRDEPSNFSTPFIWENSRRTEIITTGVHKTRAYDLNGKPLWTFKGMSSICIPTPFAENDRLFVAGGYVGDKERPNKPVYAIRPGASGDITLPSGQFSSAFIQWMQPESAPYNPSPLLYKNRFYVLWDFGFLSSRNAITGAEVYDKQRFQPRGRTAFTSSPWAYRDHLFCLSEDGDTYVVRASDTFTLSHVNALNEMCMASPAMANGSLYIRTLTALYCIREPLGQL
ncbi:MAG: PQQ-binding-like beta-propeller repeat protein [Verrucomicrobiota bacterium]|nr:PQQ-binding-like beta-propeller repeat protein [Verrucomicrobiota bacterium]